MDVIELPLLSGDTPLKLVLESMKKHKRSAVVVARFGKEPLLFKAGSVVQGLFKGQTMLDQIGKRHLIHQPPQRGHWLSKLDFIEPRKTQAQFEQWLDTVGKIYALAGSTRNIARIITRSEEYAYQLGLGPKDCYCTNEEYDPPHEFPPPSISSGSKCPYCGWPVVCMA
jgi:hypothetical protein